MRKTILVGGWATPLKNISSSVGIILPNWMESHKIPWFQSPPTRYEHMTNQSPGMWWVAEKMVAFTTPMGKITQQIPNSPEICYSHGCFTIWWGNVINQPFFNSCFQLPFQFFFGWILLACYMSENSLHKSCNLRKLRFSCCEAREVPWDQITIWGFYVGKTMVNPLPNHLFCLVVLTISSHGWLIVLLTLPPWFSWTRVYQPRTPGNCWMMRENLRNFQNR